VLRPANNPLAANPAGNDGLSPQLSAAYLGQATNSRYKLRLRPGIGVFLRPRLETGPMHTLIRQVASTP